MNLLHPDAATQNISSWAMPGTPTSAIYRWGEAIRFVVDPSNTCTGKDWQLLGHAVLLETDLVEEVPSLLKQIACIAGIPLHVFEADAIIEQLIPWIDANSSREPALVYLTPGPWMKPEAEESNVCADEHQQLFLRALKGLLESLGDRPLVLVTAAKDLEALSPCLRKTGCFDRRICMPQWTDQALANSFLEQLGSEISDECLLSKPVRLGALLKDEYPDHRRRSLAILALRRLAWLEKRKVTFSDLVQMVVQGTSEADPMPVDPVLRYRTAVHEAGHALIAYLDSAEKTAPALCTAIRSSDCLGRTVSAFHARESRSEDLTVADLRHKIRTNLAGLAAEHLILGVEASGAGGSESDLVKATSLALCMHGDWGIALDTSTPEKQASNLAVVVSGRHAGDDPRIVAMARQCLQAEYLKTAEILRSHRHYLDRLIESLCQQDVLTQEDFETLWAESDGATS